MPTGTCPKCQGTVIPDAKGCCPQCGICIEQESNIHNDAEINNKLVENMTKEKVAVQNEQTITSNHSKYRFNVLRGITYVVIAFLLSIPIALKAKVKEIGSSNRSPQNIGYVFPLCIFAFLFGSIQKKEEENK